MAQPGFLDWQRAAFIFYFSCAPHPAFLSNRFLSTYSEACSVLPVAAVVPINSLHTDGNTVTYSGCVRSSAGCRNIAVFFFLLAHTGTTEGLVLY